MVAGAEVDAIDALLAVLLAQYEHLLALAEDGEVARLAECVEDGHVVTCDADAPGLVDLAHDGDAEVHELNGDHGVLDEFLILELPGEIGCNLLARHSRYFDLAKYGEVDIALAVDGITRDTAARA